MLSFLLPFAKKIVADAVSKVPDDGELGEKLLTLFGSIMVIYAHYGNHRACKALDCNCHDQEPA